LPADAPTGADVSAVEAVTERPPARRACVVLLGGRPFAVDVLQAREVVVLDATTPVPGAPASVIGVMNLRGNVLPVVEARPLLGLPTPSTLERPRALVLADGEHQAAIVIERVVGLATFDALQPAADPAGGGLAVGELVDDSGARATVLDGPALLGAVRRAWDSTSGG
jgi:purine-binding chemotaxis protein CheW